ncbi:phosphate ABC transporter phosphate-binding protein [Microbacterium natoriense]|uniref:Phosphate ABC transporter phosphate-binding protein n=1 Tax=Microbacterium natoriense TaxID=284570 RepID=A0AAW8F0Y8_9MICO|nr:phosphate ABC transporter substrate-binding protein PstS [Microbacterium natoriense]MDQ0648227.1 phosphate ABC transporter phosphate-binding protein [Microbacterium natoriense]
MNARPSLRTWHPARIAVALVGVVLLIVGVFGGLAPAQAAGSTCAPSTGGVCAPIKGEGSTWSANALQQWIRNVYANYQWTITYSESGSTQGRNSFANGTAHYGVSEIPYGIANSNEADTPPNRGFAYMPIVAGGTAFMYNLQIGGKRVTNLRLSGEVLAMIFTGEITVWNDPAILADNPALALPAIPIVPVVRSDGSGTSAQFTIWMRQQHPAIWDAYCGKVGRPFVNGHCGVTSNYPTVAGSGFVSKSGANGVAGYVAQGAAVGSITFVEYSYALNSGFPVVKMLNSAGYYTEPTASNVAVALLRAVINNDPSSQNYLTQDLTNVYADTDPRNYPLSSYSYIILPTKVESGFTEDNGRTLSAFTSYFLCEGQQQAETLGYSPLPVNLVKGGQTRIQLIPGRDPAITDFTIASCNNPTLDPSDPNGNALAKAAPFPADCDRKGPVQCTTGTGGAKGTDTATGGSAGADAGPADAGGAGETGESVDEDTIATGGALTLVNASPQSLPASRPGPLPALGTLSAGAGVLAAAMLPPLLGRRGRRTMLPPTIAASGGRR